MSEPISCELITWNQVYKLSRRLAFEIMTAGFRPDLIIAIARGGYVPARILADFLGLMNVTSIRIEHYRGSHKEPLAVVKDPLSVDITKQRILLVDDVSDSGDTFQVAIQHLEEQGVFAEIRSAALHHKVVSKYRPDFFAKKIVTWRWITYPWAMIEDLSVFIESMEPSPDTLEGIAERLQQNHGIHVARQTIKDVLDTMDSRTWSSSEHKALSLISNSEAE
jgi:hypothetical protein